MADELGAMRSQIEQARARARETRAQLEQRRSEANAADTTLAEQEKVLPTASARLLRQGMFAGLEGRKRRQVILGVKKEVQERRGEVNLYKNELNKFEKEELEEFEKNISAEEKRLNDYEQIKNLAQKSLDKSGAGTFSASYAQKARSIMGTEGEKLYKQMVLGQAFSAGIVTGGSTLNIKNLPSGTDVVIDGKAVNFSPDQSRYTQIGSTPGGGGVWTLNENQAPSSLMTLALPRDLSRTDILKDFAPLKKLEVNVNSPPQTFRTTGSPIRITKLNSLKSRGYIPDKKPLIKSTFMKKPKIEIKKVKYKPKPTNLFLSTSKNKSKKSLWRF